MRPCHLAIPACANCADAPCANWPLRRLGAAPPHPALGGDRPPRARTMPRGSARARPGGMTTERHRGPLRVPGQAAARGSRHPGAVRPGGRRRRRRPGPRRRRSAAGSWSRPRCRSAAAARPAGSSWRTTRRRPRRARATSSGWTSAATPCTGSGSRRPRTSPREYYASVTFDRGAKKPLVMLLGRGRHGHRAGRRRAPGRARPPARRPARGLPAPPGPLAHLPRRDRRRRRGRAWSMCSTASTGPSSTSTPCSSRSTR